MMYMKPIIQLNQSLINKIAAGEVVERPLSVVKELCENAIDAGASTITVEIRNGGLSMIRVTDNGKGIPSDYLSLAFARHATSKISSLEDLFQVETLGFRGEALSSIAAVAQVEMLTKTPEAIMGTRVEIHGGQVVSNQGVGCTNGTTLIVSNLFYNTPARLKFLKKPQIEAGYIADCLERLALGNPDITIRYINKGSIVFQTVGNGDLKSALLNVYGREVASKVISVEAESEEADLFLSGMVGRPEIARGNRQHGTFFINGRYIQSKFLGNAVESAMKTMLPSGKFPMYVLRLSLPYNTLDVNVHPTKMDVRFANEEVVFNFVENSIQEALLQQNLIPRTYTRKPSEPETEQLPITKPLSISETIKSEATKIPEKKTFQNRHFGGDNTSPSPFVLTKKIENSTVIPNPNLNENLLTSEKKTRPSLQSPSSRPFEDYQVIGLLFNTYWLISEKKSLFMIDQDAAHERVLYEEILCNVKENPIHSQQLLSPITLRLTPMERELLQDNKDLFEQFGFEIEGDIEEPIIATVPVIIKSPISPAFFTEILDKMRDVGFSKKSPYEYKSELIALAACKAAVKGGNSLKESEARVLVQELLKLDNPFFCPHGRPTIIEVTQNEIERRFKRS